MSEMGVSVHQSIISLSLHTTGLDEQVARNNPLLKKMHPKADMEFVKKHLNDIAGMWRNIM